MDPSLEAEIRGRLDEDEARTSVPEGFPAIAPIPAGRYTNPEFAEHERTAVFATSWLYAAHVSEVPNPGDYTVVDLPIGPVIVVRGVDGEVRSFFNACRHRGAPVTRNTCGTAKLLVCQYHSWAYDTKGNLKNIPEERDFTGMDREDRALVGLRCEMWQGWIFVCNSDSTEPLIDWLTPLPEQLAELHGENLRSLGRQTYEMTCNWKLAVHAFMEIYHVKTVHPESAALLYDPRRTTLARFERGHNRRTIDKHPEPAPRRRPSFTARHAQTAAPPMKRTINSLIPRAFARTAAKPTTAKLRPFTADLPKPQRAWKTTTTMTGLTPSRTPRQWGKEP